MIGRMILTKNMAAAAVGLGGSGGGGSGGGGGLAGLPGGAGNPSSASILGLKVVGGKRVDNGRLAAIVEKVKRGSVADTIGHLRPGIKRGKEIEKIEKNADYFFADRVQVTKCWNGTAIRYRDGHSRKSTTSFANRVPITKWRSSSAGQSATSAGRVRWARPAEEPVAISAITIRTDPVRDRWPVSARPAALAAAAAKSAANETDRPLPSHRPPLPTHSIHLGAKSRYFLVFYSTKIS